MKAALNLEGLPTGPTEEWFNQHGGEKAEGMGWEKGGDDRGGFVYKAQHKALVGIYGRLTIGATDDQKKALNAEFRALCKFHEAWIASGMIGNMPSVDFNREGSSIASGRDHMPKGEWQSRQLYDYNQAKITLSRNRRHMVAVNMIACEGYSLEATGAQLGHASQTRRIVNAQKELRSGAQSLVELWNM